MRRALAFSVLLVLAACGERRASREAVQLARFPAGQIVEDGFGPGSPDDLCRPVNLRLLAPVLGRGVCVTRHDLPVPGGFACPRWGVWRYEYVRTSQHTDADGRIGLGFTDIQTSSLGVEAQGEYESDVPTGLWTYWQPNGGKRAEGRFSEGKMSGPWQFWKADGSVDTELSGVYADNARTSVIPR